MVMDRDFVIWAIFVLLQVLIVVFVMGVATWYLFFYKSPRDIEVERNFQAAEKRRLELEEKYKKDNEA